MQVVEKAIWLQAIKTVVEPKYYSFFDQSLFFTDEWRSLYLHMLCIRWKDYNSNYVH